MLNGMCVEAHQLRLLALYLLVEASIQHDICHVSQHVVSSMGFEFIEYMLST